MLFSAKRYLILTIFIFIFLFRYICIGDDEIRIDNIGIISFLDDENIVKVEELYSSDIEITNIIVTSDRGVLICEYLNMVKEDDKSSMINRYGIKVKKFSYGWNNEWEIVIDKSVQNICKIVKEDSEHNYIIAGLSSDSVNWQSKRNIQVACIDKTGKLKWVKKYGKKDREITYDIGGLEIVNGKIVLLGIERVRYKFIKYGYLLLLNNLGQKYDEKIFKIFNSNWIDVRDTYIKNELIFIIGNYEFYNNYLFIAELNVNNKLAVNYKKINVNIRNEGEKFL